VQSVLELLTRSAEDFNSSLRLEEVLKRVSARVQALVDHQLFCVLLWNEAEQLLEHGEVICFGEPVRVDGGVRLGTGITGTAALERRAIREPDVSKSRAYVPFRIPDDGIRSEIAVPLVVKGRLVGVLDLESTERDAFSAEHEQILTALASTIAVALDNARLYEKIYAQEQRLERDLAAAREVQKCLLAERPQRVAGISVGTAYLPAAALGGDFYEFVPLGDERLAVAVGDVSGKGTPAALLASLTVGMLRGLLLERTSHPAEMLERLNAQLEPRTSESRFVALAIAVVDGKERKLELANAGFTQPVLVRRGAVDRLKARGLPLGLFPQTRYDALTIDLERLDVLAFLSDGLQEAIDGENREFGQRFLADVCRALAGLPPRDIAQGLLRSNTAYAGDREERPDDRAVVVLKVT
jgi:sigma-B regulation protein RsbU (phosphoserine phosphatase)